MDEQTRRELNEKIGRALFNWTPYKGNDRPMPYCTDPVFVVPLAEALRARGWHVVVQSSLVRPGQWEVVLTPNDQVYQSESDKAEIAFADTLPECLALAAARAVGNANG